MKKNQYKPIEYNISIQKERLYNIISFSMKYVPYYKNIAEKKNITISKETIFEDIKKFPVLTKEIIRKNGKFFLPRSIQSKYRLNTSGGTTGEPLIFIQDQNYILNGIAATHFIDEIGGYYLGDKLIMLWGSAADIFKNTKGFLKLFINKYIKNIYFQNSFHLTDEKIIKFIKQINKSKPKVILSYTHCIYEMAKYIKRNNLKIQKVGSIITTAGVLTKEVKELIEKTFKCRVYNRYGSREVGQISTSCEKSDKLHIIMYQQYIEIMDDENNLLNEHEKGNIIVTNLTNYGMPLIRYKIGDLGSLDFSPCPCGRGLLRLDSVYGRITSMFKNKRGDLIDGVLFLYLFYFRKNVKKYQVVQNKIDEIDINIVTLNKKQLELASENELKEKIKIIMGDDCKVNIYYHSDIPPSKSGKFQYLISNI